MFKVTEILNRDSEFVFGGNRNPVLIGLIVIRRLVRHMAAALTPLWLSPDTPALPGEIIISGFVLTSAALHFSETAMLQENQGTGAVFCSVGSLRQTGIIRSANPVRTGEKLHLCLSVLYQPAAAAMAGGRPDYITCARVSETNVMLHREMEAEKSGNIQLSSCCTIQ